MDDRGDKELSATERDCTLRSRPHHRKLKRELQCAPHTPHQANLDRHRRPPCCFKEADLLEGFPMGPTVQVSLLLLLLTGVQTAHGLYGYAQAVSSVGSVLGTIRVTSDVTDHHQQIPLGNPNGARFGVWLDEDCSFTAKRNGQTVFQVNGPATLAREMTFDWMAVDCEEEPLPKYESDGGDVFGALAYGGYIPYSNVNGGSLEGLAKRGEAGAPPGCYNSQGSYEQTCSAGVWVTKKDAPDETCWICAACPPRAPDDYTCVQAPDTCSDVANVQGNLVCK